MIEGRQFDGRDLGGVKQRGGQREHLVSFSCDAALHDPDRALLLAAPAIPAAAAHDTCGTTAAKTFHDRHVHMRLDPRQQLGAGLGRAQAQREPEVVSIRQHQHSGTQMA